MIKLCPEVRVCWFGSSPRFGDEVMEIGVATLGQKCGIGEECGIWGEVVCGGWKLVDSLHNSTPLTIPRQRGPTHLD